MVAARRRTCVGESRHSRAAELLAVDARYGRKNARSSSAYSSGSSNGAKCPPRSGSVTRTTFAVRSSHARGGQTMSPERERSRMAPRPGGRAARRDSGVGAVHAHRRADRAREPVERDVREDLVLCEAPLDVAVTVAPRPELLDDPRREPGRRVREADGGGLWLRAVHGRVGALGRAQAAAPSSQARSSGLRSAGSPVKTGRPASVRWTATTRLGWSSAR